MERNKSTLLNPILLKTLRRYSKVNVGGDIYLFGYPGSIGLQQLPAFDYSRPLLRKGIIAGKYDKQKTIIIDAPSYWGNSGGAVFEKVTNGLNVSYYLIGIVSCYIPFYDQSQNLNTHLISTQAMNSGYSVITPIDCIFDLIKQLKVAKE